MFNPLSLLPLLLLTTSITALTTPAPLDSLELLDSLDSAAGWTISAFTGKNCDGRKLVTYTGTSAQKCQNFPALKDNNRPGSVRIKLTSKKQTLVGYQEKSCGKKKGKVVIKGPMNGCTGLEKSGLNSWEVLVAK